MAACRAEHGKSAGRLLGHLQHYRRWIAFGIFAPLLLLLGGTLMIALGQPIVEQGWLRLIFRTVVAATVVTVSLSYFRALPDEPLRSPPSTPQPLPVGNG